MNVVLARNTLATLTLGLLLAGQSGVAAPRPQETAPATTDAPASTPTESEATATEEEADPSLFEDLSSSGGDPAPTTVTPPGKDPWDNGVDPFATPTQATETPLSPLAGNDNVKIGMRAIGTLGLLDPAKSSMNPGNGIFKFPREVLTLEARPDISVHLGDWSIYAKPRLELSQTLSTTRKADTTGNGYLLEWLLRWEASESMHLSVGSEFLQWGPSLLISPSNMFFLENARTSPIAQVPGSYFARAVYNVAPNWTASVIANFAKGEEQRLQRQFEQRYALKLDYTGPQFQATGIASYGERSKLQAGGYAVWTPTDSLLLYTDLRFDTRSQVLYPTLSDKPDPFSYSMQNRGGSFDPALNALVGASLTLPMGVTLGAEYLYQSDGYNDEDTLRLRFLRSALSNTALGYGHYTLEAVNRLPDALEPGLLFLRRNYTVLQARYEWAAGDAMASLWWIHNWDDNSNSFVPNFDIAVSNHVSLVGYGVVNFGAYDSEFRSHLNVQGSVGAVYTF